MDIGFSKLVIEGDSVQVINAISSSKANLSQLGQVFDHMQNLDLNPIKDAYADMLSYIVSLVEKFTLKLEKLKD